MVTLGVTITEGHLKIKWKAREGFWAQTLALFFSDI
jgi:hypothetical protein